jgi:hypothetical protein
MNVFPLSKTSCRQRSRRSASSLWVAAVDGGGRTSSGASPRFQRKTGQNAAGRSAMPRGFSRYNRCVAPGRTNPSALGSQVSSISWRGVPWPFPQPGPSSTEWNEILAKDRSIASRNARTLSETNSWDRKVTLGSARAATGSGLSLTHGSPQSQKASAPPGQGLRASRAEHRKDGRGRRSRMCSSVRTSRRPSAPCSSRPPPTPRRIVSSSCSASRASNGWRCRMSASGRRRSARP